MGQLFGSAAPMGGQGVGTLAAGSGAGASTATAATSGIPWGGIGKGLGLAGAALGTYSAIAEGDAANAAGMRADKVARIQAKEIEAKTGFDQLRQAEEGARTLSTMEAAQGASGAVTTQGSPLLAMAKQASELELTNLNIGREGMTAAANARYEGKVARWSGKAAQRQGYLKAGGTALMGFATMGMG